MVVAVVVEFQLMFSAGMMTQKFLCMVRFVLFFCQVHVPLHF